MLFRSLPEPRMGVDERGNEVLLRYQGEHIKFIKTDDNGDFDYSFYPRYGEAGDWKLAVFPFERLFGNAPETNFTVKGMIAEPANLQLAAVKNSVFSKVVKFKNAALVGERALNGLVATLTKVDDNNIVGTLDTQGLADKLMPGETTTVIANFSAPLHASDTAIFKLELCSDDGVKAISNIKLNLRPAVPIPITNPKSIKLGMNPNTNRLVDRKSVV